MSSPSPLKAKIKKNLSSQTLSYFKNMAQTDFEYVYCLITKGFSGMIDAIRQGCVERNCISKHVP